MLSPLVLVDTNDRPIGTADKRQAHTAGWLHRAFSVFVFDTRGRLLLQQRAPQKYHSAGLWSNTCCSHPAPGEPVQAGAHRRLKEEMGFDCPLEPAFQRMYRLRVGPRLIEHEYNHVFLGISDAPTVAPKSEEVINWAWWTPDRLRTDVQERPYRYTSWFRHLLEEALSSPPAV